MAYLILIATFIWVFFPASFAGAGIYRYVDESGVVQFTNCPRDPKFEIYIRDREDAGTASPSVGPAPPSASVDSGNFDSFIREFAEKYRVDFALIKAMIRVESGFNPYAISRKGAKGLMQLMPETALRMNVANVFNVRENIEGGVRYFRYLLALFNDDLRLSLAAYNAGENAVAQNGTIPPYRETVDYVRRVVGYYRTYKQ